MCELCSNSNEELGSAASYENPTCPECGVSDCDYVDNLHLCWDCAAADVARQLQFIVSKSSPLTVLDRAWIEFAADLIDREVLL